MKIEVSRLSEFPEAADPPVDCTYSILRQYDEWQAEIKAGEVSGHSSSRVLAAAAVKEEEEDVLLDTLEDPANPGRRASVL